MQQLLRFTGRLSGLTALTRARMLAALLLSLWLGAARPAQAQVDTYQFAASQGTYTPLAGGTAIAGLLADTYITPTALPLGFTFVFDGTPYTEVKAASDGYLTFGTSTSSSLTNALATASAANRPLIAPLWDDLDGRPAGATAQASYLTTGTAPNRVFTFEWLNWEWRYNATGPVLSFQVKLYETSNRIEFVYRQESAPTTATATSGASIGLAGAGTGSGSYLSVQDATASPTVSSTTENATIFEKPATGQVYAFTPAAPAACPAPRSLAATVQGTSATLTWTVTGGTGPYSIEYGPTGFTLGSGTVVTSTTPTTTLSNLLSGTPYQFYVTQNCGGTNGSSTTSGPGTFTTAITNDDPTGAIALPVTASCTPTNGTNTGATTTTVNGYTNPGTSPNNCGIAASPKDVWFTFTTPATGVASTAVRVQVTGVPASQLRAFSAASPAGPFTQIGCSSTSSTAAAPALDLSQLTPNTTYYVRVSGYGSSDTQGAFTICVSNPPSCVDPRTLTFSNITATTAQVNFVPGAGNQTFTVTATPTAGGTPITATGATSPIQLTGLTSGTGYSIAVTSTCPDGSPTATLTGTLTTTIPNDDPVGAIALTVNATCTPTSSTNVGATTTTANGYTNPGTSPNSCGIAASPKDVWFTFTTPATGVASTAVRVQVTGVPASQLRAFSAASSAGPFTQIGCSSTSSTAAAPALDLTQLAPNTMYYVRVSGYGSSDTQGAFTICVTFPPTCGDPRTLTFSNTTQTATQVNFVPGAGQQTFTVTATPTAGGPAITATGTTSPIQLTGLTAGTPYNITVVGQCPDGSSTATLTGTVSTLIINDNPDGAVQLTLGADCLTPTSATLVGATNTTAVGYTNPGSACTPSTATAPRDVWFKFTTAAAGVGSTEVTLTTTGNNANVLRVFSAASSAGPFSDVACKSSTGSTVTAGSLVVTGLTPGTTYYVSVAGYSNTTVQSAFTICVRGNSSCPLPVGLTAAATTATTASLTWAVASTTPSGSFVIEYGPQGFTPGTGAGTVVTSATLGTTLTGLTADTQYCFYVSQDCGTLNGSSQRVGPVCFRTDIAPANNDEPCVATALTVGAAPLNATTVGATTTIANGYGNPGCTTAGSPKDVWFRFVAPAPVAGNTPNIVVSGNTAGQVRLFSAATCNGPFTQLACQPGAGPNTQAPALVLPAMTPGETYYVSVSGYASNDAQGPFTIALATALSNGKGELPGGEVSVFPNPSHNGTLNLAIRGAGAVKTVQAVLFNSLGQQVLTETVAVRSGAVQQALPVQGLAKGLYTLRVQVGGNTITRKVVLD